MDLVLANLLSALGWLLGLVKSIFDVLFFWLPDDFLMPHIKNLEFIAQSHQQAFAWLNWFLDVGFFITVFSLAAVPILAWAAFKLLWGINKNVILKLVELFKI
jgi:hypothetical protein